MKLFHQQYGSGFPLVVLHGLLGTLDNWHTFSRRMAERFGVRALDARNHGRSPHAEEFGYRHMVGDVKEYFTDHSIASAHLLGHSMGGKTAMLFALQFPHLVRSLVAVDIAPRVLPPGHNGILGALNNIDLSRYEKRADVNTLLERDIPEKATRMFLLKNLMRDEKGKFKWKPNLAAITKNYDEVNKGIEYEGSYMGKTLFVRGERSGYVTPEDTPQIRKLFPNAEIVTIPDAGHWVHADQPEEFFRVIDRFLS